MNFYINAVGGGVVPGEKKLGEIRPDLLKSGTPPRIGVLVNPLSGGNLNGLEETRKVIADTPRVISSDVVTPEDITAALGEFARQNVNLVAVNGGDGTVQAVLTALFHLRSFETLPLLTVLQSGTTSMIAGDVGMRGSRAANLRRLFAWGANRNPESLVVQRPVLQVQIPGEGIRYGMFFGAAGVYEAILYCRSKMHTKGLKGEVGPGLTLFRYLWAMVSKKSDLQTAVPVTVALDDNPPQHFESTVLLISTLERLLLGFRPFWGRETEPVRYTAVRAHPRHLLRALPSIVRGRRGPCLTEQNGYFSRNARQIRLNLGSGFTLDGQMYHPETSEEAVILTDGGTASFLRF